MKPVKQ